ncbi:MAG: hypothetical protein K9I35_00695 [Flavobacterium sp.]|jgi:hypothetical protein|nr:hypothetical protein [Flavobacterium sp.]
MKKVLALLLLILISSCQYLGGEVPSKKELLDKELNAINWNEVDEFPYFSECDKIKDESLQKQCFFEFLTQTIQEKLTSDTLASLYPELDTIEVKVTVFPNSTMKFEPQFPKDSTAYDTIKIDSILQSRLVNFPKVHPATKRGLPVKTQFILPVIIKSE